MNSEPIMAALFAKLAAVPGIVTSSRILKHFSETPPGDQPALFQSSQSHIAKRRRGLPTVWTFDVPIYLYLTRGLTDVPDAPVNALVDAIEAALAPSVVAEVQTLGGLCEHCWIEGAVQIDAGTLGEQVVALVPIRILVTS